MIEYLLRLRPAPDTTDVDGIRRLRAWLKRAGRAYGLRCVSVEAVEQTSGSAADAAGARYGT